MSGLKTTCTDLLPVEFGGTIYTSGRQSHKLNLKSYTSKTSAQVISPWEKDVHVRVPSVHTMNKMLTAHATGFFTHIQWIFFLLWTPDCRPTKHFRSSKSLFMKTETVPFCDGGNLTSYRHKIIHKPKLGLHFINIKLQKRQITLSSQNLSKQVAYLTFG